MLKTTLKQNLPFLYGELYDAQCRVEIQTGEWARKMVDSSVQAHFKQMKGKAT